MNREETHAFFAQYYGQDVLVRWKEQTEGKQTSVVNWQIIGGDDSYLLLTDLKDITDEDAVEVGFKSKHHVPENREWSSRNVDFLRSKGYALPYNGRSVEELIELGKVKLRTK